VAPRPSLSSPSFLGKQKAKGEEELCKVTASIRKYPALYWAPPDWVRASDSVLISKNDESRFEDGWNILKQDDK
jgi:hypothetical protein